MFDKYEDYPNGISRHAILSASATQLSRILEIEIAEYRDAIERCLENSDELESPLNRLSNMGRLLNETLSSWNRENNSEETAVVQASIYIGSILEGSLQFFLLCFEEDFRESNWRIWENKKEEDFEAIRNRIGGLLTELADEGILSSNQRKSLKKALSKELTVREKGKKIERIMLDELIRFFEKFNILWTNFEVGHNNNEETESSEALIERMDNIREARNSIHIFSKYETPTPEAVVSRVRDLCLILKDLLFRTRCINEETRRQAFLESLLEIPGATYIEIDDSYRITSIRHSEDGR